MTTYKTELIRIYEYLEERYLRTKLSDSIELTFNGEFILELTEEQCKEIIISLYKKVFSVIKDYSVYDSLKVLVQEINSNIKNIDKYRKIEIPRTKKAIITGTEYRVTTIIEHFRIDMYRSIWEYLCFFTSNIWNAKSINNEIKELNKLKEIIENKFG